MTSGQETEFYSYNPAARTGLMTRDSRMLQGPIMTTISCGCDAGNAPYVVRSHSVLRYLSWNQIIASLEVPQRSLSSQSLGRY